MGRPILLRSDFPATRTQLAHCRCLKKEIKPQLTEPSFKCTSYGNEYRLSTREKKHLSGILTELQLKGVLNAEWQADPIKLSVLKIHKRYRQNEESHFGLGC